MRTIANGNHVDQRTPPEQISHLWILGAMLLGLTFISPAWGQGLGCYESAKTTTSLDTATELKLCCAKSSAAPVSCFNRARAETTLSDDEAITLCSCANSTKPVDCFNAATAETTLDATDVLSQCARNPDRGFNAGNPPGYAKQPAP